MTAFKDKPSADPSGIDWTIAIDQHRRWLMSVLRSRISNTHVVEDLFQEVSLAVLRQESRPTDPEKVAPWLYRLAVRHVINFHRRTGRQKRLQEKIQHRALVEGQSGYDALDWMLENEQRVLVRRAIEKMRPRDREILMLKYTENWTYQQLARHLGTSTGTIEYRLIRAKKQLRRLLAEMSPQTVHQ